MTDQVQVEGLEIRAADGDGRDVEIVRDVSFSIPKGTVLALIGESGSGKTTIALSLMGYARPGVRIAGGQIRVGDLNIRGLDADSLAAVRGNRIAYIAQSAAAAFNPSLTIMRQVIEPALIHGTATKSDAEAKAVQLFRDLALPNPESIGSRYPHQVSGGQLQRLMAAMALITDPDLVILDEPTTALDVTTQIEVLRAFKEVVRERGATALYVSHDLAVVAQIADEVVVLQLGQMKEKGAIGRILAAPGNDYTKTLLAAARPAERQSANVSASERVPLLEIRDLAAGYGPIRADGLPRTTILKDIDLTIERGSALGVIGESGSGKSTLARVIAGLLEPARGQLLLEGAPLPSRLTKRSRDQFRRIQIVFQNADTALNPSHSVARILGRPLEFYHGLSGLQKQSRIFELLDLIRLPRSVAGRSPGELSGGQKQRVNLARALAAEPDLILCDEVTSALDTVVGAAILELMASLRKELGLSIMFISHDISTVRAICDEVAVLYSGRLVERSRRGAFRAPPFHPYTDLLVASVPELRPGWLEETAAQPAAGVDSSAPDPAGDLCVFRARCPVLITGVCDRIAPPLHGLGNGKDVLCHHSEEALKRLQRHPATGAAA
jgi:peptide/nickel transport system ATP-binding protein